jgi:nitrile hydratase
MLHPPQPVARVLQANGVAAVLAKGSPTARPATAPARFKVGDAVRTRARPVDHHTRLPGYSHGKRGEVESVQGMHVFADTHAQGLGEQPQWLYRVAFSARELWRDEATPGSSVALDAWESYLEPAA